MGLIDSTVCFDGLPLNVKNIPTRDLDGSVTIFTNSTQLQSSDISAKSSFDDTSTKSGLEAHTEGASNTNTGVAPRVAEGGAGAGGGVSLTVIATAAATTRRSTTVAQQSLPTTDGDNRKIGGISFSQIDTDEVKILEEFAASEFPLLSCEIVCLREEHAWRQPAFCASAVSVSNTASCSAFLSTNLVIACIGDTGGSIGVWLLAGSSLSTR